MLAIFAGMMSLLPNMDSVTLVGRTVRRVRALLCQAYWDSSDFLFGTADRLERLAAVKKPLHHYRHRPCSSRLVLLPTELLLTVACSLLELVVVTIRLLFMVVEVRGMLRSNEVEEENVPELINACGYKVKKSFLDNTRK